jgi:hypothetical protein
MLLLDSEHDDGPFCLCASPCGARMSIEKVQPHLLAALAADEHADRTMLLLDLARCWNAGLVPLTRKALFMEHRWPQ